jgi:hypothetical protein
MVPAPECAIVCNSMLWPGSEGSVVGARGAERTREAEWKQGRSRRNASRLTGWPWRVSFLLSTSVFVPFHSALGSTGVWA